MNFYSHPVLKFRTKDRLHISKEPGLFSWVTLFSINIFGIIVDYYLIPDHFLLHAGFLSLCLILSLNFMKTWDLIMDREENLGTMIQRSWYHVFSIRVPEENVERFPLSAITSVVVTSDSVVEIFRREGSTTKIISDSCNYSRLRSLLFKAFSTKHASGDSREFENQLASYNSVDWILPEVNFSNFILQPWLKDIFVAWVIEILLYSLREEISTFLCLERIEYLRETDRIFYEWDVDPWIGGFGNSESQDSDNETQDSNPTQGESQFQYGSNIKIITGVLS